MGEYFIIETTVENKGLGVETWEFGPFDSRKEAMEDAQRLLLNTAARALERGNVLAPSALDQALTDLISERLAVLSTETHFIGFQVEAR